MADGGPQETSGAALARPKRPFGRSLADFRIEGACTLHDLHPAAIAPEQIELAAAIGSSLEGRTERQKNPWEKRFALLAGLDRCPAWRLELLL